MTATRLSDRFGTRTASRHLGTLVAVAVVMIATVAAARTTTAERVFAIWLAAALPAAGFAVAGAVIGRLFADRPLIARTPASIVALARAVVTGSGTHDLVDRVTTVYGAAAVAPTVVAATVVAFDGGDRAILVCCWLLTALCAAAGAAWAVLPSLTTSTRSARAPVGGLHVGGSYIDTAERPDALAVVSIALRAAAVGTLIAAAAAGGPPDSAVTWVAARPPLAAAYAILVALVAAPGAEAGCFAAAAFVAFGPAAVIGFAATAAVCDARLVRTLQMLVGRGSAWRTLAAALPVLFAGAVWTGVMLR